ncbi:unnamed protein product [Fraxinus pennsylvanica]|uniref:DAGKc domain-containing protein n=1 Tax=Fraxinus pennsylvanica TaxID=56036 RepID=A0AAD2EDU9_9LAMI|nr:unnamed protein product [Fraxinus pennsylvanica]
MTISGLDSDKFVKQFYIPDYIFLLYSTPKCPPITPECPVLVFINSKSGGQLGEEAPDNGLCKLYLNLERLKFSGDKFATKLEENLKIIVAGGDGTAGWLPGVVSDLKLSQPPPIAMVPLGTGNNFPFAFGWVELPTDSFGLVAWFFKLQSNGTND